MSLKIIQIPDLVAREKFFSENDIQNSTWVVSDLRSKLYVQKQIKEKLGYFEDEFVLRARELWQKLLFRIRPEIKVLSPNFIQTKIQANLKDPTINPKTLASYIEELIPLLSHPGDFEDLQEWFNEHPESLSQWGGWFMLSRETWDALFSEQIIAPSWQAGFLLNCLGFEKNFNKKLIFDLGPELLAVESELIRILSLSCDVVVLEPNPIWKSEYPIVHHPYESLRKKSFDLEAIQSGVTDQREKKFYRVSTALAEVKMATAQIRQWIDAGITPEKIIVLGPDIEEYWPSVAAHFEVEGIPVNKSLQAKLSTKLSVIRWRSILRANAKSLESRNIEMAYFEHQNSPDIAFEDFLGNYSLLFSKKDLERQPLVSSKIQGKGESLSESNELKSDNFLNWAVQYWPEPKDTSDLAIIIKEVLKDVPFDVQWPLTLWLDYLDRLVTLKEFEITPALQGGVEVQSLMSAQAGDWSHRVYLGLSEEQMKGSKKSLIRNSEILSIEFATGHLINHPDRRFMEYQLRWLETFNNKQSIYIFSETNFDGKELTPSVFWIRGKVLSNENLDLVSEPFLTRWDELQLSLPESSYKDLVSKQSFSVVQKSLSPGAIESFHKCPFVLAAEKILHLKDPELIDIDPDAREKGTIVHECLKALKEQNYSGNTTVAQLEQVVDDVYLKSGKLYSDIKFRELSVRIFAKTLKRFLINEDRLKEQFPQLMPKFFEKDFELYFHREKVEVILKRKFETLTEPERANWILLRGKLDRLDCDQSGNAVVFDYKTQNRSFKNTENWLEDYRLQLFFYALAAEIGGIDSSTFKVKGAAYYGLKDMSLAGFVLSGTDEKLFSMKSEWADEKLKSALTRTIELSQVVGHALNHGVFPAKPNDIKNCENCQWSKICRAEHLEL